MADDRLGCGERESKNEKRERITVFVRQMTRQRGSVVRSRRDRLEYRFIIYTDAAAVASRHLYIGTCYNTGNDNIARSPPHRDAADNKFKSNQIQEEKKNKTRPSYKILGIIISYIITYIGRYRRERRQRERIKTESDDARGLLLAVNGAPVTAGDDNRSTSAYFIDIYFYFEVYTVIIRHFYYYFLLRTSLRVTERRSPRIYIHIIHT